MIKATTHIEWRYTDQALPDTGESGDIDVLFASVSGENKVVDAGYFRRSGHDDYAFFVEHPEYVELAIDGVYAWAYWPQAPVRFKEKQNG